MHRTWSVASAAAVHENAPECRQQTSHDRRNTRTYSRACTRQGRSQSRHQYAVLLRLRCMACIRLTGRAHATRSRISARRVRSRRCLCPQLLLNSIPSSCYAPDPAATHLRECQTQYAVQGLVRLPEFARLYCSVLCVGRLFVSEPYPCYSAPLFRPSPRYRRIPLHQRGWQYGCEMNAISTPR